MKIYLAIENGMCLNYINLHNSQLMRLRNTELTNNSLRFDTILYNDEEILTIKALHPNAEIVKFNGMEHFKYFRNALVLS